MLGLPAGLRLVIDNAIANAVKHGDATRSGSARQFSPRRADHRRRQRLRSAGGGLHRGVRAVPSRLHRAQRSGSGLGLALVAQQAELHGGTARLEVSPMGGTRWMLLAGAATAAATAALTGPARSSRSSGTSRSSRRHAKPLRKQWEHDVVEVLGVTDGLVDGCAPHVAVG